jgi:two-component system sensor histidine kinase UhpB
MAKARAVRRKTTPTRRARSGTPPLSAARLRFRQAVAALQESARRFADAERVAGFGSWEWEPGPDRVVWSDELFRIFGLEPGERRVTLGLVLEFVHPEDRERVRGIIDAGVRNQAAFGWEGRILRPDGEVRVVAAQGEPFPGGPGGSLRMVGVCQDVTQRWRAEEALRNFSVRVQEAREAEAARIAREIHDELGQTLTALKMDVAWLERKLRPRRSALGEKLRGTARLADEAILSVRRIATALRPGVLDDVGLIAALEWLVSDLEARSGIAGRFECGIERAGLPREAEIHVFRLVQEALTNVVRHSEARRVVVRVSRDARELRVEVRDDGLGIGRELVDNPRSLGLTGMRERARLLGAQLAIAPLPEAGTRVSLRCPLPS